MIRILLAVIILSIASLGAYGARVTKLESGDRMDDILIKAAGVKPAPRQLAWQELEFACFIHFGVNTFTDREWGEGTEDPQIFNPSDLDAIQWVKACKDAGISEIIFTAKHHDGFCLWPSKFTEHSVKNSPWKNGKGDVVKEISDACRKGGIKFGVYLSPWDRHDPSYGDSPKYNEHFRNQLRELLTNYGPICEVWFDGACGEGPNGKRQEYDYQSFYDVVRELQPNAAISICGPDVRWCGNEAGVCRESEWSVVPESCKADDPDIGSREKLTEAAKNNVGLIWHPAQVDTSIRPGWFYHSTEDNQVKSLDHLLDVYFSSVGGNAQLLLNIPPDRRGRFHENDVQRLHEIGEYLRSTFTNDLIKGARATASVSTRGHDASKTVDGKKGSYWATADGVTFAVIEYDLGVARTFNTAMLQEYIANGQHIEEFFIDAWDNGKWQQISRGTTVGHKRILRFDDVTTSKVRLRINKSRVNAAISSFGLFRRPLKQQ